MSISMVSLSVSEFSFTVMLAFSPRRAFSLSPSMSARSLVFMLPGATRRSVYLPFMLAMDMFLKYSAASLPMASSEVMRERSVYSLAVFSL